MTRRLLCSVLGLAMIGGGLVMARQPQTTPARIEIGWCATIARLEVAKSAGFDYVELNTQEVAALSDADYEALRAKLKQLNLPTPVSNSLIPRDGSVVIVGPNADVNKQNVYIKKALDRMAGVGVRTIVFGTGKSVPAGWTEDAAFTQIVDFDRRLTAEGRARGILIVIEPTSESNFIRTVGEGLRLINASPDPNLQVMADYYHMSVTKDDPDVVLTAGDHLRHIHMANPQGRVFPLKWEEYDYGRFFANLRQIGYRGRISVEASSMNVPVDGPQAIALLRKALGQ